MSFLFHCFLSKFDRISFVSKDVLLLNILNFQYLGFWFLNVVVYDGSEITFIDWIAVMNNKQNSYYLLKNELHDVSVF